MKIWYGYGSEHSARLVMIGKFKEVKNANEALIKINALKAQAKKDEETGNIVFGDSTQSYSNEMLKLLGHLNVGTLGPSELEQFMYDITIDQKDEIITFKTEEVDVSAIFKLLIHEGAKVEIFSGHDYPDEDD